MPHVIKRLFLYLLLLALVLGSGLDALAKKGGGLSDKEAQKLLDEADKSLSGLLIKTRNRQLLSPEDSSTITTVQLQLIEIQGLTKPAPSLPKVLFQMATLLEKREAFQEAADYYDTLGSKFATSPYGGKAKLLAEQLRKNHPETFSVSPK
jgi:hypothetical protein